MPMERLDRTAAERALAWLDDVDSGDWYAGYDAEGWEDSIWLLNAMYVAPEPIIWGSPFDGTGHPQPEPHWPRITWRELAETHGSSLPGSGRHAPGYHWLPEDLSDRVLVPPDGVMDHVTAEHLLDCLGAGRNPDETTYLAIFPAEWLDVQPHQVPDVRRGSIDDLRADVLHSRPADAGAGPFNIWPEDRSWFVYTDLDLPTTRVSGTTALIEALEQDESLDTHRWSRSTHLL